MTESEIRTVLKSLRDDFERQAVYVARKIAVPAALAASLSLAACDGKTPIALPYMAPPHEMSMPDIRPETGPDGGADQQSEIDAADSARPDKGLEDAIDAAE